MVISQACLQYAVYVIMKLALSYFFDTGDTKIMQSKQIGVDYAVTGCQGDVISEDEKPWDYMPMLRMRNRYLALGVKPLVVEGPPPMDKIKLGLPGREEELNEVIKLLDTMSKLGYEVLCYNWMPVISWFRTSFNGRTRGGALATEFSYEDVKNAPLTWAGEVSEEKLWDNLKWFLERIVPVAESTGIKLALHPDDPPVTPIRRISRILIKPEAFQRVIDMYPSPCNGITLCQGSFRAQGADVIQVIKQFVPQNKVFFIHFRDVEGEKEYFKEVFHDDGPTDMYQCMKLYHELGFDGPIRPDHVPTIVGDKHDHPGYTLYGNFYAVGYMKGLIEAVEREELE